MLRGHTTKVKMQDFSAVNTMLKHMLAAKLTAFLTSMACAHQAEAQKTSFASQSLGKHHTPDWTSVICVAHGILACLVLAAFHVGKRYSVKNHEIEVKIARETLETALGHKESSRDTDDMVLKGKVWNCVELRISWRIPRCQLTKSSSVGTESSHVTRDCKAIVDTTANSRLKCNWC